MTALALCRGCFRFIIKSMETNGYKPEKEKEPEPITPSFESEVALRGLVDAMYERLDKEAFRVFHRIADSVHVED